MLQLFLYIFRLDINDCKPSPCQNGGTCIDGVNSYTCKCRKKYAGKHCENSKFRWCSKEEGGEQLDEIALDPLLEVAPHNNLSIKKPSQNGK